MMLSSTLFLAIASRVLTPTSSFGGLRIWCEGYLVMARAYLPLKLTLKQLQ